MWRTSPPGRELVRTEEEEEEEKKSPKDPFPISLVYEYPSLCFH